MAKTYKGSLSLEWYNKQKSILLQTSTDAQPADIPAPRLNWVNKEEALFYEIDETEGKGKTPYWVDRNDIRVKEARPLILQKVYQAIPVDKPGSLPGMDTAWRIEESTEDDPNVENILIKGDNLLALNTLKKMFDNKPEEEKVKCIYIDPPYNTGQAFALYEDNLAQSEWFTLMRDRIENLHKLLREDGVLFIQLDEKNLFHIRVILDEIFGKSNFLNIFTVKTSDPSGLKTVNPSPYDSAEYILMFAKNKSQYKYETIFVESQHDFGYSKYITNITDSYEKWNIVSLNEYYALSKGFNSVDEAKKKLGKLDFLEEVAKYAIGNAGSVFQLTAIADDAGYEIVKTRDESKNDMNKIYYLKRDKDEVFVLNGRQMYFYSNKIKIIEHKQTPTLQLTNIWNDIPYNGLSKEGGVKFKESKKPEKLIKRVIEISNAKKGDLILDCFGGSGTSLATAHKMNMKWIGVELGNHADTHIIPRITNVLEGKELSGITDSVTWHGGGSFKYYHLGESIIKTGANGQGDFNWSLGRKHIEESFLFSYDYQLATDFQPPQVGELPAIGVQRVGNDTRVAIISLCGPEERGREMLGEDELMGLFKAVSDQYKPRYVNIFTNRGVELAYDAKPDNLEVIKVPHAIFSELEK